MKKITAITTELLALPFIAKTVAFADDVTINVTPPPQLKITNLGKLISSLISLFLIIAALSSFVFLLWGGIQWITSGGDKSALDAAKNRITAALLGLLITFAAYAIFLVVEQFLGIQILGGTLTIPSPIGN